MKCALMIAALMLATPAVAAASTEDRAVARLRGPAEAGDARAQYQLGRAYQLGKGVPTDARSAISWYRRAADQADPDAIAALGLLMFREGQRQDAMPWITRAAAAGEPRALYVLGTAHFNGDFAPRDWPRAYAEMSRAVVAGIPEAVRSLSQMQRYMSADDQAKGKALAAAAVPVRAPASPTKPEAAPAQAAPKAVAVTPPMPARTTVARARPAGRWRVQLGAYRSDAAARAAWTGLAARVPALGSAERAVTPAAGVFRLQASGLANAAAARALCRAVSARGNPCFAIAP